MKMQVVLKSQLKEKRLYCHYNSQCDGAKLTEIHKVPKKLWPKGALPISFIGTNKSDFIGSSGVSSSFTLELVLLDINF